MKKFTIKDLNKALDFLKQKHQTEFIQMEFDHLGRLLLSTTDINGVSVTITIFDEESSKFPEVTKTERL